MSGSGNRSSVQKGIVETKMPKDATQGSSLLVTVFDGTRQPMKDGTEILYRVIDGNQKQIQSPMKKKSSVLFRGLPFYDNFGDNYTVIVSAKKYGQAGFVPVHLTPDRVTSLDLMLLPKDATFNFSDAKWEVMLGRMPFLGNGVPPSEAKERYQDLMEEQPAQLAALLNITTAMSQIFLPQGTPLDYLKQIVWEKIAQDRFFAYADCALIDQVKTAAEQKLFAPEIGPGFFHPGATLSFKQIQFGEANVQLTFHENDTKTVDGVKCVLVEPDIDYYRDLGAHTLLEVIPNTFTGGLSNPKAIYVLRWIAGRRAAQPEFNPPYRIV